MMKSMEKNNTGGHISLCHLSHRPPCDEVRSTQKRCIYVLEFALTCSPSDRACRDFSIKMIATHASTRIRSLAERVVRFDHGRWNASCVQIRCSRWTPHTPMQPDGDRKKTTCMHGTTVWGLAIHASVSCTSAHACGWWLDHLYKDREDRHREDLHRGS
jgi:hypothetical protein